MSDVKVGDYIYIDYVDGEPGMSGMKGIVTSIDDIGQLHGTWCGIAINEAYGDIFYKIGG